MTLGRYYQTSFSSGAKVRFGTDDIPSPSESVAYYGYYARPRHS